MKALAIILGVLAVPASASETIRITTVAGYPQTAAWVMKFEDTFVPAVDAILAETDDYRINWVRGWGGSIARPGGELTAVEFGLADLGLVQTSFHPDRLRVYDLSFVTPFVTDDLELITRTVNDLTKAFPQMLNPWEKANQVLLTVLATVDNYQILLKGEFEGPQSLSGKKIGGAGPNLRYLDGTGAIGVASNLAEFYNGLTTGVYDGVIAWAAAADAFKLYEPAPIYVRVDFGGVSSIALTMNRKKWLALPEEVQDALRAAAELYRRALAEFSESEAERAIENLTGAGVNFVEVDKQTRRDWANALPDLAGEWLSAMEESGINGSAILDAYMTAMRAADANPLREWSSK